MRVESVNEWKGDNDNGWMKKGWKNERAESERVNEWGLKVMNEGILTWMKRWWETDWLIEWTNEWMNEWWACEWMKGKITSDPLVML
jgi:hypothetical protein